MGSEGGGVSGVPGGKRPYPHEELVNECAGRRDHKLEVWRCTHAVGMYAINVCTHAILALGEPCNYYSGKLHLHLEYIPEPYQPITQLAYLPLFHISYSFLPHFLLSRRLV